jgi:hypothetical protein
MLAQGTLSAAAVDSETLRQQRLAAYGGPTPVDTGPTEAPEPTVQSLPAEPVTLVTERLHSFRLVTICSGLVLMAIAGALVLGRRWFRT